MLNKLKHIVEYKNRVESIMEYLNERQRRILQGKLYKFDEKMLIVFHSYYSIPTFSIFYGAKNEVVKYRYKDVDFFVDITIKNKKELMDFLLEELNYESDR